MISFGTLLLAICFALSCLGVMIGGIVGRKGGGNIEGGIAIISLSIIFLGISVSFVSFGAVLSLLIGTWLGYVFVLGLIGFLIFLVNP